MLRVDVSKIPPEGLDIREALDPAKLFAREREDDPQLEPGGSLSCHVEVRDEETVHVAGDLTARLRLVCGRCLEAFPLPISQHLELFCLPHREGQEEEDEVELSERDMVVTYYRDRSIDLAEVVREQLFLAVPMKRLCSEGCQGLCPRCGKNRNAERCECPPVDEDPRLAGLRGLLGR